MQVRRSRIASRRWEQRSSSALLSREKLAKYEKALLISRSSLLTYLIIHNNTHGGSHKWVMDLRRRKGITTPLVVQLSKLKELLNEAKSTKTRVVVIINSFLRTDIAVEHVSSLHCEYGFKILIPIHDWYWFNPGLEMSHVHSAYLTADAKLAQATVELLGRCEKVICPSKFVYTRMRRAYSGDNLVRGEWNDYDLDSAKLGMKSVGQVEGSPLNIGVLVGWSICKGEEQILHLCHKYPDVSIVRVGIEIEAYEDTMESFIALIKKHNIHGLLYLNKWGETWCYALTKGLCSGLPILYNNIGAFKERIPKNDPKYIINNNNEAEYYDYDMLELNFKKFLSYVRNNNVGCA
jgi:hypothetical protein